MFSKTLPIAHEHMSSLVAPAALSTVLTGFLILTTRSKAITQVVGYLILENGVVIFGLLLMEAIPFLEPPPWERRESSAPGAGPAAR